MIKTETRLLVSESVLERLSFVFTRQTRHLEILYRGINAHIFVRSRLKSTGKSITCTQVGQSNDNHLVD